MKKRTTSRLICCLTAVVLLVSALVNMSGCGQGDAVSNLGTRFTPYDPQQFITQTATPSASKIAVVSDGVSRMDRIGSPAEADIAACSEREAAELRGAIGYLQEIMERVTHTQWTVADTDEDATRSAIRLQLRSDAAVSREGHIRTVDDTGITLQACSAEGLTAGIYTFLQDKLGCAFLSPEYDYVPELKDIWLEKEHTTVVPSMTWRYLYCDESDVPKDEEGKRNQYGNYWYSKLRLNGAGNKDWFNWVHTSFTYVSPDEYFDEHPEYFSYYMGKRTYQQGPVSGQLCWTNEDVYQIIRSKVLQEMRDNPDKHYWEVSQMDTWESRGVGCQCDACKAIDDAEGSPIGSILTFINRLADDVKREFPDNYISTLAYNYSATPPKNIRPRDNVIIKLCLMPGDASASYADPHTAAGRKAHDLVTAWGEIAPHIVIWDYNIDFHNYMMPFPILDGLQGNNDFYLDNNVYGVFHQYSADAGGDLAVWKSYLQAQLLWNRDIDIQQEFNRFLTLYYGDAAPYVAEYYGLLAGNLQRSGDALYIYAKPVQYLNSYLSPAAADDYLAVLAQAEQAVASDPELLARVQRVKTGALFTKAIQFSADMKGRQAALDEFMQICKDNGWNSLVEGESNGDELQQFYDSTRGQIRAMPAIILGMILGSAAIVAGVTLGTIAIVRLVRRRRARSYQQEAQA